MSVCTHCGKALSLPMDDKCNYCHELEAHLPKYLASQDGEMFVRMALQTKVQQEEDKRQARKKAERDARIDGYKKLGRTELMAQIYAKQQLVGQMVGNLYPQILERELEEMEEALQERTWQ